jgi:hypothetical protein
MLNLKSFSLEEALKRTEGKVFLQHIITGNTRATFLLEEEDTYSYERNIPLYHFILQSGSENNTLTLLMRIR